MQMQSVPQTMEDLKQQFDDLYMEATTQEGSRLVPICDQLKVLGIELNMAYRRKLRLGKVCPHRDNRDGAMASGKESMNIWNDIDKVGVSADLYRDATAFEEPSDRPNETKWIQLTKNDEHLVEYRKGDVEVASVACSHWNQALYSAAAGKATPPNNALLNNAHPSSLKTKTYEN